MPTVTWEGGLLQTVKASVAEALGVHLAISVSGCIACASEHHLQRGRFTTISGRRQYEMAGCCERCYDAVTGEDGEKLQASGYMELNSHGVWLLQFWLTARATLRRLIVPRDDVARRILNCVYGAASWPVLRRMVKQPLPPRFGDGRRADYDPGRYLR